MKTWIEGAIRGEAEAYEQLMKQFRGMALAVAYHKLEDAFWAEDVVQEAFTEAFANLSKLEKPEAFPGWFKVIVERQCYRWLRRRQHATYPVQEIQDTAEASDEAHNPEQLVLQKEVHRILRDSITGLPSSMRHVVDMFYFQGYSLKEISDFLSVSIPALKKRLYDARAKLRQTIPVADVISVFRELHEGGKGMLHITNGDHAADRLRQSGIEGEVLVWRELYTFGPVARDMGNEMERSKRAAYLEHQLGIPQTEYLQIVELERKLHAFHEYKEIVLWFEYDLYDQAMLSYLLHYFKGQSLGDTKLNLLCIDAYPEIEHFRGLGQLTPGQIGRLSGTWHMLGTGEIQAGSKFWEAYTSPDIRDHMDYLKQDTSIHPFAHAAFEAHLSRMPSLSNGLGVIEQTTLEAVRQGVENPYPLFKHVGDRLHVLGMGDLEYWAHLRRMTKEPHALLHISGVDTFPDFTQHDEKFRYSVLSLTELGNQVLAGEVDWAELTREESWIGGLWNETGKKPLWRWDTSTGFPVKMES
ncbi:sigma-70 family RNA polymerase sigma factor [Paenibacillus xylanilyticus]|uniref:Sigma-70 family RNA polymerase sigma factor n=1 Tax=Paenibacillus xylanilyticus TaxID=248903 RepID=A0A7Y6C2G0_9BACL|nr:sigma-70 family RNA polymerase sigma factor [Paenibacillus xylanilyticus]NUU78858.1 sigma-70 family RNA polymerase sigma factor [Paenibacillus xylanilyticus]